MEKIMAVFLFISLVGGTIRLLLTEGIVSALAFFVIWLMACGLFMALLDTIRDCFSALSRR